MTLPKFAYGMFVVLTIVAVWSLIDNASWSTIALRVVACAVILQIGYFITVVLMIDRQRKRKQETATLPIENTASQPKVSGEQKLSG